MHKFNFTQVTNPVQLYLIKKIFTKAHARDTNRYYSTSFPSSTEVLLEVGTRLNRFWHENKLGKRLQLRAGYLPSIAAKVITSFKLIYTDINIFTSIV